MDRHGAMQSFGGMHSKKKLEALAEYLKLFNTVLQKQSFQRYYIDLFAGSGGQYIGEDANQEQVELDLGAEEHAFLEGSPRLALQTAPSFHHFVFSDFSQTNSQHLEKLKSEFPNRHIDVRRGNANTVSKDVLSVIDWKRSRGVLFLDPFGAQVDWTLLEFVRSTEAIDVWYLFPTGAVIRMTPRHGNIKETWAARLTSLLGTESWKAEFFKHTTQQTLFPDEAQRPERQVTASAVETFVLQRLANLFPNSVKVCLRLNTVGNSPLYSLCFAASNPGKGGKLAVRLAEAVIRTQRKKR
ncbi:MAG TPA: three-Cys-motif partner protein TcmP [Terriglobales bacterium]|nr:three-Cys-motif partner protein TcmP [Terriglobales bacterium]